jgi:phage pi2 protein 07
MLNNGDVFVFGGGNTEVINSKTAWGLFLERRYDGEWSTMDSAGYKKLHFRSGNNERVLLEPEKGKVIDMEGGIAIYMGNLTYMSGDMKMTGILTC